MKKRQRRGFPGDMSKVVVILPIGSADVLVATVFRGVGICEEQ